MSLIERKYERTWFNTVMNAMSFAIDAMKDIDPEKYQQSIRNFSVCQEQIVRYSVLLHDEDVVKVRCPDIYYDYLIEAKIYVDYVSDESGYDVDWAAKVDEETNAWRQRIRDSIRDRKIFECKSYYEGWLKYQEDHKGEKRVTKSAYAKSIGEDPDKVRNRIHIYESTLKSS